MKITRKQLSKIIKEEVKSVMDEGFFNRLFRRDDPAWAKALKKYDDDIHNAELNWSESVKGQNVGRADDQASEVAYNALQDAFKEWYKAGQSLDMADKSPDQKKESMRLAKKFSKIEAAMIRRSDDADSARYESNRQKRLRAERAQVEKWRKEEEENKAKGFQGDHDQYARGKFDPGDYRDGDVMDIGRMEE
jgi:hypothetical protein